MFVSCEVRSQKLCKVKIRFITSVRLSFHKEQLGSHWTDVHEILDLRIFFKNLSSKIRFLTIRQENEDQYTFMTISRSFLVRMRNVSDKSCRENQNKHFVFSDCFFPPKIVPFMR